MSIRCELCIKNDWSMKWCIKIYSLCDNLNCMPGPIPLQRTFISNCSICSSIVEINNINHNLTNYNLCDICQIKTIHKSKAILIRKKKRYIEYRRKYCTNVALSCISHDRHDNLRALILSFM